MRRATFKGGIHPFDGKNLSKDKPMQVVLPKGDLVYPMAQHIGAPAKPVVAVGDQVLVGQVIGEASSFISANVCSSVSGKVKAIEKRLTVSGAMAECIVVENDNEYTTVEGFGTKRDYKKMTKEEIRQTVKDAGIVGMGGAGFPTNVKITPKNDNEIDFVIVNGAECEPYLTSDYRLMLEQSQKIIDGLKIVLSLFKNAKGYISIEDNKPEAIKALQELAAAEERIEVKVLKTKYPQGSERKIIYATCGRKINSKMLPSDAGCIVNNIATIIAIYNAVSESTPVIERVVTVTGDAVAEPGNFVVRTGTNYRELVDLAGGFVSEPEKIVCGGPMMGMALYTLDVPVTKTSSALLAMVKDPVAEAETSACIRCGRCVQACPSGLVPQKMMQAIKHNDLDMFEKIHGMECYECGSCTYVCPAKVQLTQAFKLARKTVMDNRRKAQNQ
ncbi:electron transport complex protein RnfC [Lachnospiraceae bacterium KM106-2]|nr:electron transport complex protein RnfC [Lachnospiraceae bacterium KM106-2]